MSIRQEKELNCPKCLRFETHFHFQYKTWWKERWFNHGICWEFWHFRATGREWHDCAQWEGLDLCWEGITSWKVFEHQWSRTCFLLCIMSCQIKCNISMTASFSGNILGSAGSCAVGQCITTPQQKAGMHRCFSNTAVTVWGSKSHTDPQKELELLVVKDRSCAILCPVKHSQMHNCQRGPSALTHALYRLEVRN